eukprot:292863_1
MRARMFHVGYIIDNEWNQTASGEASNKGDSKASCPLQNAVRLSGGSYLIGIAEWTADTSRDITANTAKIYMYVLMLLHCVNIALLRGGRTIHWGLLRRGWAVRLSGGSYLIGIAEWTADTSRDITANTAKIYMYVLMLLHCVNIALLRGGRTIHWGLLRRGWAVRLSGGS